MCAEGGGATRPRRAQHARRSGCPLGGAAWRRVVGAPVENTAPADGPLSRATHMEIRGRDRRRSRGGVVGWPDDNACFDEARAGRAGDQGLGRCRCVQGAGGLAGLRWAHRPRKGPAVARRWGCGSVARRRLGDGPPATGMWGPGAKTLWWSVRAEAWRTPTRPARGGRHRRRSGGRGEQEEVPMAHGGGGDLGNVQGAGSSGRPDRAGGWRRRRSAWVEGEAMQEAAVGNRYAMGGEQIEPSRGVRGGGAGREGGSIAGMRTRVESPWRATLEDRVGTVARRGRSGTVGRWRP